MVRKLPILLLAAACTPAPQHLVADQPGTPTPPVAVVAVSPAQPAAVESAPERLVLDLAFEAQAPDAYLTEAVVLDAPIPVYAHPYAQVPREEMAPVTVLGTPTTLLVLEDRSDGWTRVMLPGRPNGRQGWIRPAGLDRTATTMSVVVDLEARTLTVFAEEEVILEAAVAVGSSASPTPSGRFYVTDSVQLLSEHGPWGPFAFGLSARSDTITEFNGGDGIIGIHGTNRPDSIGRAASLGCVRLDNETIRELWEIISIGTPVEIRA